MYSRTHCARSESMVDEASNGMGRTIHELRNNFCSFSPYSHISGCNETESEGGSDVENHVAFRLNVVGTYNGPDSASPELFRFSAKE